MRNLIFEEVQPDGSNTSCMVGIEQVVGDSFDVQDAYTACLALKALQVVEQRGAIVAIRETMCNADMIYPNRGFEILELFECRWCWGEMTVRGKRELVMFKDVEMRVPCSWGNWFGLMNFTHIFATWDREAVVRGAVCHGSHGSGSR